MGVCASCLGQRRQETFDEDDDSRMLLDDPNSFQYGSFSDQNINARADPLESQRETEAVQKVVTTTSNNLVDIFEIHPQETAQAHQGMLPGQDGRLARYHAILAKLSADDDSSRAGNVYGQMDWLSDDEVADMQASAPSIKEGAGQPLVGTFADAAAA